MRPLRLVSIALAASALSTVRADDLPAERATPSCGPAALFLLLRLEGRGVRWSEVADLLPADHPEGHSLGELRDAARALGLALEPIRLEHPDEPPDRPVIAFIRRGGHGHFQVIRPVGRTGKLVQVIQAGVPVDWVDFDRLAADPAWTGLALRVRHPGPSRTIVGSGLLLAGSATLHALRRRRSRFRTSGPA